MNEYSDLVGGFLNSANLTNQCFIHQFLQEGYFYHSLSLLEDSDLSDKSLLIPPGKQVSIAQKRIIVNKSPVIHLRQNLQLLIPQIYKQLSATKVNKIFSHGLCFQMQGHKIVSEYHFSGLLCGGDISLENCMMKLESILSAVFEKELQLQYRYELAEVLKPQLGIWLKPIRSEFAEQTIEQEEQWIYIGSVGMVPPSVVEFYEKDSDLTRAFLFTLYSERLHLALNESRSLTHSTFFSAICGRKDIFSYHASSWNDTPPLESHDCQEQQFIALRWDNFEKIIGNMDISQGELIQKFHESDIKLYERLENRLVFSTSKDCQGVLRELELIDQFIYCMFSQGRIIRTKRNEKSSSSAMAWKQNFEHRIKGKLSFKGFNEVRTTYVVNPNISPNMSPNIGANNSHRQAIVSLRKTMFPGLFAVFKDFYPLKKQSAKIFELGPVFKEEPFRDYSIESFEKGAVSWDIEKKKSLENDMLAGFFISQWPAQQHQGNWIHEFKNSVLQNLISSRVKDKEMQLIQSSSLASEPNTVFYEIKIKDSDVGYVYHLTDVFEGANPIIYFELDLNLLQAYSFFDDD